VKVVFSKHALLMLTQRGLEKARVLETVKSPDFAKPTYGFREERYRLYKKNHLKVVIKTEKECLVIVTAHWVATVKTK
jgi:hypothetical protein